METRPLAVPLGVLWNHDIRYIGFVIFSKLCNISTSEFRDGVNPLEDFQLSFLTNERLII